MHCRHHRLPSQIRAQTRGAHGSPHKCGLEAAGWSPLCLTRDLVPGFSGFRSFRYRHRQLGDIPGTRIGQCDV